MNEKKNIYIYIYTTIMHKYQSRLILGSLGGFSMWEGILNSSDGGPRNEPLDTESMKNT